MKFHLRKKSADKTKKGNQDNIAATRFQFNDCMPEDLHITLTPPQHTAEKTSCHIDDDNNSPRPPSSELSSNGSRNGLSVNRSADKNQGILKSNMSLDILRPRWGEKYSEGEDNKVDDGRRPRSRSLNPPKTVYEKSPRIKVRSVSFVTSNGFEFSVKAKSDL